MLSRTLQRMYSDRFYSRLWRGDWEQFVNRCQTAWGDRGGVVEVAERRLMLRGNPRARGFLKAIEDASFDRIGENTVCVFIRYDIRYPKRVLLLGLLSAPAVFAGFMKDLGW